MSATLLRRLIWIPIIHTQADLGSMSESVRQLYIHRMGKHQWFRRIETIETLWHHIRIELKGLDLDYATVRLYQDGLPVSGHEQDIVCDLAKAGSANHQLLVELIAKGATLTGTEAPELLLEEYETARQTMVALLSGKGGPESRRVQELSKTLLDKRDDFIAHQIARTLRVGETGLVFLGMLHSLEQRLPADIEVLRLRQKHEVVSTGSKPAPLGHTGDLPSEQDEPAPVARPDHG